VASTSRIQTVIFSKCLRSEGQSGAQHGRTAGHRSRPVEARHRPGDPVHGRRAAGTCCRHRLRHAVAFVCAAEILGLAGFSLVPALLPQFITTWSLSNAEAAWLAGMMSAGYMAGVLPLVALTDRMPARTIFSPAAH
jgi:hypothetical protein